MPDAMRASQVDGTSNLVLLDKPQRLALPEANVSFSVEASAVVSRPSPGRARARQCPLRIQKGTRVRISLWDSLMFGRVPKKLR